MNTTITNGYSNSACITTAIPMVNRCDEIFKHMCSEILVSENTSIYGHTRPKWEDGSEAFTNHIFGFTSEYDLKNGFPVLSLRKLNIKNAVDEILWIWQKKSNNVNDLNSHIWDAWANEDCNIGKAYGYQVKHRYRYVKTSLENILSVNPNYLNDYNIKYNDNEGYYSIPHKIDGFDTFMRLDDGVFPLDQMDYILHELKYNPSSRRILGNLYTIEDLPEMNLDPCAYSITLGVNDGRVHMILNQRSQDVLVANNWNVFQYSILLAMIAQVTGYKPGRIIHVIADCHIYDRHVDIVKELIQKESLPPAKIHINPNIKCFYDFTVDDVIIDDYQYHPLGIKIPVAE